jgi:thioredoxin 2
MVRPAVVTIGRARVGRLEVVKVNLGDAPAVAARFDTRPIPILVLVDPGRVLGCQAGAA